MKNRFQVVVVERKNDNKYDSEEDLTLVDFIGSNDLFNPWFKYSTYSCDICPFSDWFNTYVSCRESIRVKQ